MNYIWIWNFVLDTKVGIFHIIPYSHILFADSPTVSLSYQQMTSIEDNILRIYQTITPEAIAKCKQRGVVYSESKEEKISMVRRSYVAYLDGCDDIPTMPMTEDSINYFMRMAKFR